MKNPPHRSTTHQPPIGNLRKILESLAIAGGLMLSGNVASAGQILANPGFESGLNNWTVYSAQTWNYAIIGTAHSGANALKLFGAYNGVPNWSGVLQQAVCAPGCTYLADGWGFTLGSDRLQGASQAWLEVSFRDSANTILALYRSAVLDATTPTDTWLDLSVTNQFDPVTQAPMGAVSSLVAPTGTVVVQFQVVHYELLYDNGSEYWDDLTLNQIAGPTPPVISGVSPNGSSLFNLSATNFTFTASSSTSDINPSGIRVAANGADVSSLLTFGGTARNRTASYALKSNELYTVSITVTDAVNFYASATVSFDTFGSSYYVWEAEDYDFSTDGANGGQFFDNPVLSSVAGTPNSYFGLFGVGGVDYMEAGDGSGNHLYRPSDTMATDVATDIPRQKFIDAQVSDPNLQDYKVGWFDAGEWLNFTRTFPAGKFNVYARVDGGAGAATVDLSQVTSGAGTPTQTTELLGSFSFVGRGWAAYDWVPLKDSSDNLVAVSLNGNSTLRATTHGGADLNFFMLVAAKLDRPTIANIYPDGTVLMQHTNQLGFTVSSPSTTIPAANIQVTLNGVNVSSQLAITGSSLNKSVLFTGLKPSQTYTAAITVIDANGTIASSTVKFDTFNPSFTWEAEDWDYNGGQFISSGVVDAYAGQAGQEGIDYHDVNGTGAHLYRPGDTMAADNANDTPRTQFTGTNDYAVGYFATPEWINYTRNYGAGTYNLYGRFAAGGGTSSMSVSRVTRGVGTADQQLSLLGNFTIADTGGWSSYAYVPLRDRFGNLATVTLPGATTLRLTRNGGADANINFFLLVPARTDLPTIACYPDGATLLQGTNRFVLSAANLTIPISSSGIQLTLNGVDVTSQLAVSGSANSWSASLPLVPNFTNYTAVIHVTDTSNQVATTTIYFDTFGPTNFTWEAEDWDYNGGQFIDNPAIDEYMYYYSGTLGVDYWVDLANMPAGATYLYHSADLIGTEVCSDTPLPKFAAAVLTNATALNYDIGWLVGGQWVNFTRTYPAGNYFVYGRFAGGAAYQSQLDQVTVTATNRLGMFSRQSRGWTLYDWTPLVDTNGQRATVSLGGVSTLRFTSLGGANANLFMLAPAVGSATPVRLIATASGANVTLSFPTLSGYNYKVYYASEASGATWNLLTMVAGDGSVKSVSDSAAAARRFYRLEIQ